MVGKAGKLGSKARLFKGVALVLAVAAAGTWLSQREDSSASVTALAKEAQGSLAQAEGLALSRAVLSDEDLPPAGTRSLFDHFAAQQGGVPYPFPKLVEALTQLHPEGQPPVLVMLPHGRSLLKGQSDNTRPRVLLATDFQAPNTPANLGVNMRGQLFLGFVENANEIEVLSYNEAAGRFEFQLVQDYSATGARKLVYARRAICLTCHQGGAPIFSQRPWEETNAATGTAEAMLRERTAAGLDPHQYLGLDTTAPLAAPERFDELTDVGNFFASTQHLWLDGCGDPATLGDGARDCRRTMLKLALQYKAKPGDFKEEGPLVEQLRTLQTQSLGQRTIPVAESDIPNRNPVLEQQGLKGWWHQLTRGRIELGDGAKNNEDLEAFDALPKLPRELDPLTPRAPKRVLNAQHIDGAYGLASLLTEADIDTLLQAHQGSLPRLMGAVDRLPTDLLGARPFERAKTVQALLGAANPVGYVWTDTKDMSPPLFSGVPPLELSANSPLQPFETYCFSCHRGNPAKKLNFMGAATEDEVLAQIREKVEIRDALDWQRYVGTDKDNIVMPPQDSKQYAMMQEALKHNPQLLDDMRKQVPSLFGF
ncbi:hypothetical protein [Limnobacter sp.]|uniref:hypothetical protein n=1 Tax=Limnobacter sp. TaxID=2003368 RepID=UPI00351870AB